MGIPLAKDSFCRPSLGFQEHTKQLLTLLPLRFDPIVLVQQVPKEIFFVKFTHQPVLHNIFAVIDEQMHNSFGDLVSDGLSDDIEVGGNESADKFCLQSLPLGEFRVALGGLILLVRVGILRLSGILHWGRAGDVQIESRNR